MQLGKQVQLNVFVLICEKSTKSIYAYGSVIHFQFNCGKNFILKKGIALCHLMFLEDSRLVLNQMMIESKLLEFTIKP